MNIRLRQMTGVFLQNGPDMLLMKRAETMRIAPGLWAGVGGHLEPEEIGDPAKCALRELEEETGITQDRIHDFRLQAVVQRRRGDEIRIQYIYLGTADTRELGETVEGTLHWVSCSEVLNNEMSAANQFFLKKYFANGPSESVWIGTLGNESGHPLIQWAILEDWEPM